MTKTAKRSAKRKRASRGGIKPLAPAIYRAPRRQPPAPRDTLAGDFAWAGEGGRDAAARWRTFLRKYDPADGEYQDAGHERRVRTARYELMRLEYLSGNAKAGDRLLAKLQDVDA